MVINQRLPLRNQVFYSSALPNNFPAVLCHTLKKKKVILFIYFWLFLVFVAAWAFLQRCERRLPSSCSTQASACGGFSCCGAQAIGRVGSVVATPSFQNSLNSYGSWAQLPCSLWSLPGSGTEPVSPPLPGGFFTTEPPGRPQVIHLMLPN